MCYVVEVHKHGILEVDDKGIVQALVEKPKAEDTSSRKAVSKYLFYTCYVLMCIVSSILFVCQTSTTITK